MDREDWTPAVLITATVCLVTAGLVWVMSPWGPMAGRGRPGPPLPLRHMPATLVVWTGELAPGLKGVLGPVWGDTGPDRDHDEILNGGLGLGDTELAWFRLLVFNTSETQRRLALHDGDIVMDAQEEGAPVRLRSLAGMLERKEIAPSGGLAFSLRTLGALQDEVEIPPGRFARLLVTFGGKARLESVRAVVTNGAALKRRQMATAAFRRLLADPDEAGVADL